MPIKQYNPTSAGRRLSSVNAFAELTRWEPEKSLTEPKKKTGGRNHTGWITCRHIGGGHKQLYRKIDFKRNKDGIKSRVEAIEYDPNRSCFIALLAYEDGEKRYILAPQSLKVGDVVESGTSLDIEKTPGNAMPLEVIPVGLELHNIESHPGQGGKIVRSAGGVARLIGKDSGVATIQLPSGEVRQINAKCRATIGQLGNADWANIRWGKAGRMRYRGIRPTVRGVAQNPVSHPLGGGEGRSGGGRHPVSKWGVPAKGGKTRNPRKNSSSKILRRRMTVRYGESVLRRR
ncbi:MAG: 50S ribosomal protein L2 [Phycisphaerae bacterium]